MLGLDFPAHFWAIATCQHQEGKSLPQKLKFTKKFVGVQHFWPTMGRKVLKQNIATSQGVISDGCCNTIIHHFATTINHSTHLEIVARWVYDNVATNLTNHTWDCCNVLLQHCCKLGVCRTLETCWNIQFCRHYGWFFANDLGHFPHQSANIKCLWNHCLHPSTTIFAVLPHN